MSATKAVPYLFFNGDAEQALELYRSALGAEIEGLMRYSELPAEAGPCPPAGKNRIMHCLIRIGKAELMVSDRMDDRPEANGHAVHVALTYDDAGEMTRSFAALAKTGKVLLDIHDAFWGDKFGALEDQHGIFWMFTGPGGARR